MSGTPYLPYIGYAAGALTVLSLVPQVARAYRTRHVGDLSWGLVVLLVVSGALWLVYGVLSSQLPVILTNAGVVALASALAVAKLRFRQCPPRHHAVPGAPDRFRSIGTDVCCRCVIPKWDAHAAMDALRRVVRALRSSRPAPPGAQIS